MAKHIINTNQITTIDISDSSPWIIAKGATLTGNPGLTNHGVDDVKVMVAGRIASAGTGFMADGFAQGYGPDNLTIEIAKTGRVTGGGRGISADGDNLSIENYGLVKGGSTNAIEIYGDSPDLTNHGKIVSNEGRALSLTGDHFDVENHGLMQTSGIYEAAQILAYVEGRFANGADGTVIGGIKLIGSSTSELSAVNSGRITACKADGLAVEFGAGDDMLTNRGRIDGMVDMGDGDDTANIARGKLVGAMILGGDGDDTFIIGKSNIHIAEYEQGGTDTIKTARSYEIAYGDSNFIEKLVATSKADIDLKGSVYYDTTLVGNAGKNVLTGGNGDDVFTGGKGADTIYSYAGEDSFSFFSGDGSDTIHGFHQGDDKIRLNLIDGIKDFDDLDGRISLAKNEDDTIIDLGNNDRIRLVDFHGTLTESDFSIIGEIVLP